MIDWSLISALSSFFVLPWLCCVVLGCSQDRFCFFPDTNQINKLILCFQSVAKSCRLFSHVQPTWSNQNHPCLPSLPGFMFAWEIRFLNHPLLPFSTHSPFPSVSCVARSGQVVCKAVWRLTLKLVFTHHSSFVTTTGPFPFSTWMMHGAIALPVKMNLTSIARLAEVARQFAESS